ncbi:MAG: MerR family transcriptional regulator [Trebonia sp.]
MTGLRVSELAARAGVNASAVRFYERAGLLPAARRGANGYRVFDDSALADLALIAQAKGIGMTLEEITSLLAAWHGSSGGTCQDAHALLREHLTEQETRLNHEIAGLAMSRQRSQASSARLAARPPDHESCHAGCACAEALEAAPGDAENRPAGCTLDEDALACRVGEWRALAAAALSAERDGGFLTLTLEPAMVPATAALIAAEATCCPDARFTLTVAAGQALLTAEFPC